MTLHWEGEEADSRAAQRAAGEREAFLAGARGDAITIANEFAEVRVVRVDTRNGSRLLIESPKSGQWVALDPLELEALTCLVISLYDAPNVPSCPYHEHSDLIDAIEAGDGKRAAALMVEHLNHVEGTLEFRQASDEIDFDAVFA